MPDSTPKWTPGPWTYTPIPGYQYVVEIDRPGQILLITTVPLGREVEVAANMRLAAAAPEMYAALEGILSMPGMEFIHGDKLVDPVRKALAKARGESDA